MGLIAKYPFKKCSARLLNTLALALFNKLLGIQEALVAYRTGAMVHVMHSSDLEWWAAGGMSILGVFAGLFSLGMGLGWIKPKERT